MNTRFLEAFVWAARLGSFRQAADKLHITQAAISNRIAALEQDFDTRLFDRNTREIHLTFAGRRLLAYAERMLLLNREMRIENTSKANIVGPVHIGVIETILHTWLIPFLQQLQEHYPGIEIQLTSESTLRLHEQLRQCELDIALQTDALIGDNLHNIAIGSIAMGWVGRTADWPDCCRPFSVAHLVARPVITMNRSSQPHAALKSLCQQAGVQPSQIHCVSSISAIVRLVQSGFGIAVLPLASVREHIDSGALTVIPCEAAMLEQRIVISYREDLTSEANRLVALLACQEAEQYIKSLNPLLDSVSNYIGIQQKN